MQEAQQVPEQIRLQMARTHHGLQHAPGLTGALPSESALEMADTQTGKSA